MIHAIGNAAIRFRYLLAFLSIVLIAGSTPGFKYFLFDASPRSYFEDDHPHYNRFVDIEDQYGTDFIILFMISAKEGDIFSPDNLKAVEMLTNEAWLLPHSQRIDSISNYQYSQSINDEMLVEALFEEIDNLNIDEIAKRKQFALTNPSIMHTTLSADGKHAGIIANINVDSANQEQNAIVTKAAYALADKVKAQHPNIDIHLTGNIVSNYETVQIAIRDMSVMIPTMFVLMFVMIGTLMRTISGVFVALTVAVCAVIPSIAFSAWLGITFSVLAMNAVIIGITVAIAHCIHIFHHFFHAYQYKNKKEALLESLEANFFPVTVTSLTTCIGFLSLNLNELPPASALGNASALATFFAWLFSLTILPALVMLLPFKKRSHSESGLNRYMLKFADFVIRKRTVILFSMLIITCAMIYFSLQNILNDRFSEMIHKPHKFRTHTEQVDKHFGGMYTIHYSIPSGEENGIAQPEYLKEMDKFANYLRQQPEVLGVTSIADVVKRLNQDMHNNDSTFYRIPESRELTAQYLLLYELSLPYGLDLNNQLTPDKSSSRIVVTLPSVDTSKIRELEIRFRDWQKNNFPIKMQKEPGSMAITWAHLSYDTVKHSITGALIALALISCILLLMLRSIKYGLISLLPNILPAAFGFGGWYFLNGEIGLGLTCVLIITIGIVVDDTVHFLSKYQRARKELGNTEDAIRYTISHVGSALWITTLVLITGFAVLSLSKMIGNSALGEVTAIILAAALILDLLLLPSLLLFLDKDKEAV